MTAVRRLALLVLALVPVSAAFAQPKPAQVKDIDQPGRAKYQETLSHSCQDSSTCYFFFSAVPAGKRLVVTWVSANYVLNPSGDSWAVLFLDDASGVEVYLAPLPAPSAGTFRIINSPAMMYVEAGNSPSVELLSSTLFGSSAKVTLVGYYISVP